MINALLLTWVLTQAPSRAPQSGLDTAAIARDRTAGTIPGRRLQDFAAAHGSRRARRGREDSGGLRPWELGRISRDGTRGDRAWRSRAHRARSRSGDRASLCIRPAITVVHNHLVGETPRIMYVHVWGTGEAPLDALSAPAADDAGLGADVIPWHTGAVLHALLGQRRARQS